MTPGEVIKWHRYMAQFRMHTTEGAESHERMADAVTALKQRAEDIDAVSKRVDFLESLFQKCVWGWDGDARCLEDPDTRDSDYCALCQIRMMLQEGGE